jgi:hypothetical protein
LFPGLREGAGPRAERHETLIAAREMREL